MALEQERPPRHRSPWMIFLALVVLVGAGVGVWRYMAGAKAKVELEEGKVTKTDLTALVSATGTLEATTTVTVGSQVSGLVRRVLVDFNSSVRKGDVLLVLDPSEFEARVAQARASLDSATASQQNAVAGQTSAQAEVAQNRAGVVSAQANLSQSRAEVASAVASAKNADAGVLRARAERENALAEYKRFEELRRRDLVALSEVDAKRTAYRVSEAGYDTGLAAKEQAVAAHQQALARVEASESELVAAKTRLAAAQGRATAAGAQVRSAEAQVRQARASLEQALVDLERTVIRSPIDGVVIQRKVDEGQTVAAQFQAPELIKIAGDLHRMQVQADINEADIGRVNVEDPVEFRVDAYPERRFQGKIVQVRPAPMEGGDAKVVVYGVLVAAPNPDLLLKPGMTATVDVSVETREGVLTVPNQALRFIPPDAPEEEGPRKATSTKRKDEPGRPGTVWIPGPEGPKSVSLRVGITDGERTEILKGDLKEGDLVYTDVKEADGSSQSRRRMRIRL